MITNALNARLSVVPQRLSGRRLFAIGGLTIALLLFSSWLLGRRPPAAPPTLFAPAWAAGLPPAAIASGSVDLSFLPPELVVPPLLPAGLQDALLLEAWVRLYNQVEPIQLWGDESLSGRAVAQSLLDGAIPVVWDDAHVCRVGSCSRYYCQAGVCAYEDSTPGVDPIYMHPSARGDMPALVGFLAHEIFHRTQPFGKVGNTRFEEYWAMFILAQVSPADWLRFGQFDPLVPGQLVLWIDANNLDHYLKLEAYPVSITPLDLSAASAGDLFAAVPVEARGTP